MKRLKVLIVGPFPEPTTGLSLSNKVVFDGLCKNPNIQPSKIDTSLKNFEESVGSFTFKKVFFFLKQNLKAYQIFNNDVVYITIGQSFYGVLKYAIFVFLAWILGKEIIVHLHGNTLINTYNNSSKLKKVILKSILSKTTKAIVLSDSLKANFIPFIKEKEIFVLNNFVEDYLYLSKKERGSKEYNALKIVYLSNLMTEKGIFYFLDALNKLEDSHVNFQAKCAGHIDESLKESIIRNINKTKHLTYLGSVKKQDKRELLKWGNVFVFPSYLIEGLPLSILEAMVTGNIIISTEHDALLDYFDASNMYFIDKQSANDILKTLIEINDSLNDHRKMIITNYEYTEQINEEAFVNKLVKIIQNN
ncbi:glycosyltransferase family 4 protein [Winogradskyella schleiferi]|uniref:glycosyltransferase family 4 protein n=1 Tax=Winogradskyella schleiferi TaxID=2686078 RepID=UPI0015BB66C4|nr:glycosyltransferase [Winogradskyella schleiferi]